MTRTERFRTSAAVGLASALVCLLTTGCPPSRCDGGNCGADGMTMMNPCMTDDNFDPGSAEPLNLAVLPLDCPVGSTATTVASEGYICPFGDTDWYSFSVPAGEELVTVRLRNTSMLSNVDLEHSIVGTDGVTGVPNTNDFDSNGGDGVTCIQHTYFVPAGEYLIVVRDNDIGAGETDSNNPYILDIATSPDPDTNESNNDQATATPVAGAAPGYIAFKADEDWYSFTAGPTDVVSISITADTVSNVNLKYELFDSMMTPLGSNALTAMPGMPESISEFRSLAGAGTYYIKVTDSTGVVSDLSMSYTITAALMADPDGNEPNGNETNATNLGAYSGGTTTYTPPSAPRLFAPGDTDLYYIDINSGGAHVVEVNWAGTGAAPLRVAILEEGNFPCAGSMDGCVHTTETCNPADQFPFLGCESFQCDIGSSTCIGGGTCANNNCTFVRVSRAEPISGTAQPLNGTGRVYIRVQARDPGSSDMSANYSLSVTVRPDPDPEPDNYYYPNFVESAMILLPDENQELFEAAVAASLGMARSGSIGSAMTGTLAYEGDIDVWQFPNPCPGADCSLSATYSAPAGDVEYKFFIYNGGSPVASWGNENEPSGSYNTQGADSGTFGALGSSECFYASNNDSGSYYLVVRDHNLNDWSTTSYSVTINVTLSGACTPANACGTCCSAACCDMGAPYPFTGACGND